jgi:hypothetical protein
VVLIKSQVEQRLAIEDVVQRGEVIFESPAPNSSIALVHENENSTYENQHRREVNKQPPDYTDDTHQ